MSGIARVLRVAARFALAANTAAMSVALADAGTVAFAPIAMRPEIEVGLVLIGFMAGTIAHEAGHFVIAAALRLHPRRVRIGVGSTLANFHIGKAYISVRVLPLTGSVHLLARQSARRVAYAAFALGDVSGNVLLFALAGAVSAVYQRLSIWLAPIAFAQGLGLINLVPFSLVVDGRPVRSDGLNLIRTVFGPEEAGLPDYHATVIRSVVPFDAPVPPVSAHTAEILYQIGRRERFGEKWARRDASAAMREILIRGDLSPAERAVVLEFLVDNETLAGVTLWSFLKVRLRK